MIATARRASTVMRWCSPRFAGRGGAGKNVHGDSPLQRIVISALPSPNGWAEPCRVGEPGKGTGRPFGLPTRPTHWGTMLTDVKKPLGRRLSAFATGSPNPGRCCFSDECRLNLVESCRQAFSLKNQIESIAPYLGKSTEAPCHGASIDQPAACSFGAWSRTPFTRSSPRCFTKAARWAFAARTMSPRAATRARCGTSSIR